MSFRGKRGMTSEGEEKLRIRGKIMKQKKFACVFI